MTQTVPFYRNWNQIIYILVVFTQLLVGVIAEAYNLKYSIILHFVNAIVIFVLLILLDTKNFLFPILHFMAIVFFGQFISGLTYFYFH